MAYTELEAKTSTDTFSSSDWTDVKNNFEASVPHLITAQGDLAVASGSQALDNLAVGSNYQSLQSRAAATLGVEWSGSFGVYLTTDSVTMSSTSGVPFYTQFFTEIIDAGYHVVSPTTDADLITIPFTGIYLLYAAASFAANATGERFIGIAEFTSPSLQGEYNGITRTSIGNVVMKMTYSIVRKLIAGSSYRLYLNHTAGVSLNATDVVFAAVLMR